MSEMRNILKQKGFSNTTMPQKCAPNGCFLPIFWHFQAIFHPNFK